MIPGKSPKIELGLFERILGDFSNFQNFRFPDFLVSEGGILRNPEHKENLRWTFTICHFPQRDPALRALFLLCTLGFYATVVHGALPVPGGFFTTCNF